MVLLSEKFTDLETLNSINFFIPKKRFPLYTDERVTFVKDHIYNEGREFHNWLEREREIKFSLNKIFYSVHTTKDFLNHTNNIYTLLFDTDVDLASKHFFKLHPFWSGNPWNRGSKEKFVQEIIQCNQDNKNYIPLPNEKVLRMSSDVLNKNELDKHFYNNLIDFLELDNRYENANQVHSMWRNLNCKAEQDIVQFFNTNDYPNFLWYGDKFNFAKSMYDVNDWNQMKQTALEYYKESK